jgi:double-strand break repair protein MRE11
MDEILLTEVAEEEGFDVTDQMEVTKCLKLRVSPRVFAVWMWLTFMQVSELISKANDMWDQCNAKAVEEGDAELPYMLPLVRLKVGELPVPLR